MTKAHSDGISANRPSIPWLETLPTHWKVERAKRLFERMKRPVRAEDEVVTAFRDGTVTLRRNRRTEGFTESLKEIGYQGVRKGDLVIHAMDAFAGAIGVSNSDGKSTPVYSVCQPRGDANTRYYAHALRVMSNRQFIQALARGIRERSTDFRFDEFGKLFLPVPSRPEQDAIVAFLDCKLEQIDRYLATKRHQIELLIEERMNTVNQVFVPCPPDASSEKSKVGFWFIPAGWTETPLKFLAHSVTSGSRSWAKYYADAGDKFIQSGNLTRQMKVSLEKVAYVRPPEGAEGRRTQICVNDLLVCITGALTGNVAIVDYDLGRAFVNQHVALIHPNRYAIYPLFLAFSLWSRSGQTQFQLAQYGGTKQGLSLGDVRNCLVAHPSLPRQVQIVDQLQGALVMYDEAIESIKSQITKMIEYRTALVAEAVTGRLDVRQAGWPLRDGS